MKIKTQVSISLITFVILAVVIILSVYSSSIQLHDIQKKEQILDNIETSSFELYYLENDFLLHDGTIPVERWNAKYAALTMQIQDLTMTDPSQQAVLNEMSGNLKDLKTSFSNLVAITTVVRGKGLAPASQELKEFSASTLTGQTQTLMSRSSELSQLVKTETLEVEQRTILVISLSIAVLMLFVLLNYLVINRSVIKSISVLQRGAERIGSGNLDTKIETVSNDELGGLSLAFNEMSSSLKNARTLLLASKSGLELENAERKRAEGALGESRQILEAILNSIPVRVFWKDKNSVFLGCNTAFARDAGFEKSEDIVGKDDYGMVWREQAGIYRDDDRAVIASGTSKLLFEEPQTTPNGEKIHLLTSKVPLRDAGGEIVGVLGTYLDITDRKRAEDTIVRANRKLNILNDLTRRDLINQVFVVKSYLELAKQQAVDDDPIHNNIQKIEQGIQSIGEIAEFTRDYQDMGKKTPEWQNVKLALLYGISHVSLYGIHHNLEMENLEVFADPLLENAFQGLFENSVTHGEHVSTIRVSHTITPDGVTIIYEDDGTGIPLEKKEQIFLRGDSTYARIRGLFFIREILDLTDITIRETGEPGKGVRFEIIVPKGVYRFTGTQ